MTSAQVDHWEDTITLLKKEQDKLVRAGRWTSGPGDMLSILGRSRRELDHCAILAWLMDPKAPHGLGARFLEGFLKAAFSDTLAARGVDLSLTETATEVVRQHSRADIVIQLAEQTVVVEAKVDAEEGDEQCNHLFLDWGSKCWFLFLTPSGHKPTTATGKAADAFFSMRFGEVGEILEELVEAGREVTPIPSGRDATKTYLQTLLREFPR